MRKIILTLITAGLLLFACKKTNDNLEDSIIGKYSDQELRGIWTMSYSTRDMNNGITIWTDSIEFADNNRGNRMIYQFSNLEDDIPFHYYTEEDSLFLYMKQIKEKWIYTIRNDSLIMKTSNPPYSSYYEERFYKKKIENTP